jgi:alpha-L-rhamnosidase
MLVRSDHSWRSTPHGPIRYSDLLHGERYDARMGLHGWSKPGFDDSAWGPVATKHLDDTRLVPEVGQPIRVTRELSPVSVSEVEPGVHIFDLGQNMVGFARCGPRVRREIGFNCASARC